jgi:hypothetical protein
MDKEVDDVEAKSSSSMNDRAGEAKETSEPKSPVKPEVSLNINKSPIIPTLKFLCSLFVYFQIV